MSRIIIFTRIILSFVCSVISNNISELFRVFVFHKGLCMCVRMCVCAYERVPALARLYICYFNLRITFVGFSHCTKKKPRAFCLLENVFEDFSTAKTMLVWCRKRFSKSEMKLHRFPPSSRSNLPTFKPFQQ